MTTTTENTQGFEVLDIEQHEHLSDDELREYANKLYASLEGGVRRRTPGESYVVGATFRVLRSRKPYGRWKAYLEKMGLIPRSIQRLMYIADGVDEFNLDAEDFSFQNDIIEHIRSLRG